MSNAFPQRNRRRCVVSSALLVVAVQVHGSHHIALGQRNAQGNTDQQQTATQPAGQGEKDLAAIPRPVSLAGPTADAFRPFSESVSTQVVGPKLIVESDGLPDHDMMVGIRSWQQQVPLPQPFTGDNAWRLPLQPRPADNPISVLQEPLRGAIALAVNGVPIFCALNNRGDDTYLAGELDKWGGHCGRGDDYHYHTAPVHLEEMTGRGNPIGYALDGYPILGFADSDGTIPSDLDEFNGHKDAEGNYHYHATSKFPYINGGLRGVVTLDGDQIEQPRDSPVRPGQSPLQGATITGFSRTGNQFHVEYEIAGKKASITYTVMSDDQVKFSRISPTGEVSKATYRRGEIGPDRSVVTYVVAILLALALSVAAILSRRFWQRDSST